MKNNEVRIYVGNIPYSTTEEEIRSLFGQCGEIFNVRVVVDRETQRPKGFAFVSMDERGAWRAKSELNGTFFGGRPLVVNDARPRSTEPR